MRGQIGGQKIRGVLPCMRPYRRQCKNTAAPSAPQPWLAERVDHNPPRSSSDIPCKWLADTYEDVPLST